MPSKVIDRATGQQLGNRQVEDLAARAARDFDAFCAGHGQRSGDLGDVPVLSCDGKGVVMCADALRPAPRRVADTTATKLATRLSEGERLDRYMGTAAASSADPFVAAAPRRTDHGPVRSGPTGGPVSGSFSRGAAGCCWASRCVWVGDACRGIRDHRCGR